MKTIGDTLGHHHITSTAVYLRLAIDDLRIAAAPVPKERARLCFAQAGVAKMFPTHSVTDWSTSSSSIPLS